MKIALVHDYLVQYGGAERVLECFMEIWPKAPIYTLIHDPHLVHHRFDQKKITTSFLQKMPLARKHHRVFPPLMMTAIEQFNFDKFDVVLSDSSSFAKNIITSEKTLHICYCHTPMRYAWDDCQLYTQEFSWPSWLKKLVPLIINYIRTWDFYSTTRVDKFIANSKFVSGRIQKYYHRNATVISPSIDVNKFYITPTDQLGDYFLMVGRMMKYKRMDIVIEAFNELKLPLKIVGRGVEFENLQKIAGPNIEFLGRVSDQELCEIYSKAQAFLFPQEEDFGMVAIEALSSGRPVIAYRSGDVVENVVEGKSGILFEKQTKQDIIEAVRLFQRIDFDPSFIRSSVSRFEKETFKRSINEFVKAEYEKFKQ